MSSLLLARSGLLSAGSGLLAAGAGLAIWAAPANATSLPAVKATSSNDVPACATPGRMMAFLAARNSSAAGSFDTIATAYMRNGEALGIRWDYAFFQMMMETGNLSFKRGNGKASDVRPSQNNFAGLGASGNGEHGESFKDVDSGVKAHLQHLLMYAGEHIDDPVAERTRKVQEWGILTSWQKGIRHPITFEDLARQWAPGSNGYSRDIEAIAGHFYGEFCEKPDPRPELVKEARGDRANSTKIAEHADKPDRSGDKPSGKQLARAAIERARAEPAGDGKPAALGAPAGKPDSIDRILNEQAPPAAEVKTASAAVAAKPGGHSASKCRVWTASYGGQKSVIIRSTSDQSTNFTVLDVNDGQESRETDAYIAAYAKGGQKIGEFANQSSAMEKAFQLCPEG